MKLKTPIFVVVAVVALASCSYISPAPAPMHLLGSPAPVSAAERTIVLHPSTKHVNVEGGEIIRFVVGERAFAWNFFVASTVSSFELNRIAPPGLLQHKVIAYVAPDPRYMDFGDGLSGGRAR